MRAHLPLLILLAPLAAAPLALLADFFSAFLSRLVATLGLSAGFWLGLKSFPGLLEGGRWHYSLGGWAPPWGIELVMGPFSCLFACLVLALALVTLLYEWRLAFQGPGTYWRGRFIPAFLLLFTFCLVSMLFIRDLFSLYLLLEISLLAAAGLLVLSNIKSWLDAFYLLLWGSAGSSLLFIGVVFLFAATGTTNLEDILAQLFISRNEQVVWAAGGFLALAWAFPFCLPVPFFFGRLLDRTPSFLMGFLSGVLGRVGAYLLFLFLFFALNLPGSTQPIWLLGLEYLVTLLFFAGFLFAARDKDFQRTLAFLSVAQLGYLFSGYLLGNKSALTGTLMEILSQVLTVAGLFFIAGTLREGAGPHPFSRMAGLMRHRPLTGLALLVFAASIVGIPPTGGFFGKWYILEGALERKDWVILAAAAAATLFNFFYWARLAVFLSEHRTTSLSHHPPSFPAKLPFLLLAAAVLLLGIFHQEIIHTFIEPALPKAFQNLPVPNVPFLGKQVE